jgi:hypothetical protein
MIQIGEGDPDEGEDEDEDEDEGEGEGEGEDEGDNSEEDLLAGLGIGEPLSLTHALLHACMTSIEGCLKMKSGKPSNAVPCLRSAAALRFGISSYCARTSRLLLPRHTDDVRCATQT